MSYQLNRTNGDLLTDLIDGQIDTNSTNLTLVGKNYSGYGEAFNENFIRLLENFSNTAAPSNPLSGQLWWDTSEQRLKVFDGTVWKASGGPYVQSSRPQMVAGDLWIDSLNNQVYAYDGSDTILMGPIYTDSQGISGFQIVDILDSTSRPRTVAKLLIGGTLVGIFSKVQFTPIYSERVMDLVNDDNPSGIIYEGFNVVNQSTFKFRGIASGANALVTAAGTVRNADQFLPSDTNGITVGTLTIQNSGGLTIGLSQNNVQKTVGPRFYIENQLRDHDLSLRVRSSEFESVIVDAIYIDASTARVGIFTTDRLPEYTLDVEGDLRVTGNLLVEGDTTTINVQTLRVEDKNIELGSLDDSSYGDDSYVDGAGLIIKSSDSDKSLAWYNSTDSWTTNVNFDISDTTKTYKIGGVDKLTTTSLTNIEKALDLDEIGTLIYLNVDNLSFNGNAISSSIGMQLVASSGITITAGGNIAVADNQKIVGVATPVSAAAVAANPLLVEDSDDTVATKGYVDSELIGTPIAFSMDITGLGTGSALETAVGNYLNDLYPAGTESNGKVARIHTTSYAGATVSGIVVNIRDNTDPNSGEVLTISRIQVDSAGTQNESVVQDIVASNTASGIASLTPARTLMEYKVIAGIWEHQSTTAYP